MSVWVQVGLLAGPVKDIYRFVSKTLVCCLSCVFGVSLDNEHSAQPEFLRALNEALIKCFTLPSIPSTLTSVLVTAAEGQLHLVSLVSHCLGVIQVTTGFMISSSDPFPQIAQFSQTLSRTLLEELFKEFWLSQTSILEIILT